MSVFKMAYSKSQDGGGVDEVETTARDRLA